MSRISSKKVAEYIEIDWKSSTNIFNYRRNNARQLRDQEPSLRKFTILDYFYWMRIKPNYRDVDFLDFDTDASEDDAYAYVRCYANAANSYGQAITGAITSLRAMRRMGTK